VARGRGKSSSISHKGGTEFAVLKHAPHYFTSPKNIRKAIENNGLVRGAFIMPSGEFQQLLDSEDGESIFVIDYSELKKWPPGLYGIYEPEKNHMRGFGGKIDGKDMIAINHPMINAFLTPNKAGPYLEKQMRVFGDKIMVWYRDDVEEVPLCRLLAIGCDDSSGDLDSQLYLPCDGSFVGTR